MPIFSLTVVLWSFLHDKFWTRHSNELAYRVGTFDDEDRPDSVREGFRGEMHTSEVRGAGPDLLPLPADRPTPARTQGHWAAGASLSGVEASPPLPCQRRGHGAHAGRGLRLHGLLPQPPGTRPPRPHAPRP